MKRIYYLFILIVLGSCAPSRFVEPIEKGKISVGASLGGPLIEFGNAPIPVPLSSLDVGYGINQNLTIFGGIHTTALFFGNLQMDYGCSYRFLKQKNKYTPNLSGSAGFNFIWSPSAKKADFWPIIDLNAYWNYGKNQHYFYVGVNNYFELKGTRTLDQPQQYPIVFSPQIGHVLKGKERSWEFLAEIKFIAPYAPNDKVFVPYTLSGNNGATGIYLGYRKYFKTKNFEACTDCPTW